MKKITVLAAALLFAGVANAQGPTRQATNTTRNAFVPSLPGGPNSVPAFVAPAGPSMSSTAYSQDSYIEQSGDNNYSNVNQQDTRGGIRLAGSGSSAEIVQTGDRNNANQTQTLNSSSNAFLGRNLVRSTQDGDRSQSDQTQTGGAYNTAVVTQGAGTRENRAVQTQNGGASNSARITQTEYTPYSLRNSNNLAVQTQSGSLQTGVIEQQGNHSSATQTQSNYFNDAYIGQGSDGARNVATQTQSGRLNNASIRQSVGGPAGSSNDNFAMQDQSGDANNATITQQSSKNFAEQLQSGDLNRASVLQQNVSSASFTTQTGGQNSAIVLQH